MKSPWIHLVARTHSAEAIFLDRDTSLHAWSLLTGAFPNALAAILMPEHLHIVVPNSKGAIWKLGVVLRSIARRRGRTPQWEPIPKARAVADRQHLLRTVRYILLNPCRRGLTDDPLHWEWSTLRDLWGLVAHPWVSAERLAESLDLWRGPRFCARFHEYVCRDDCVSPTALRLPLSSATTLGSLADFEKAFAVYRKVSLHQCKRRGAERKLLVQLALQFGESSPEALAAWAGVSAQILHRFRASKPPQEWIRLRGELARLVADRRTLA